MYVGGDQLPGRARLAQKGPREIDVAQHGNIAIRQRPIKQVAGVYLILNILQVNVDGASTVPVIENDRLRCLPHLSQDVLAVNRVLLQRLLDEYRQRIPPNEREKCHRIVEHR